MQTLVSIFVFVGFVVGIWFSYRLFMRGNTDREKVASLLPSDFKPDLFYRKGDTYVGYEKEKNRLVLVDWPHAKVLSPQDVQSLQPEQETMLGIITHYWLAVNVPDPRFSKHRIWFQFRPAQRDKWHRQLAEICGKHIS